MSISKNLENLKNKLPQHVTLVAVSKTKPVSDIITAYNAGQRIFGENKVQEMVQKWETLPKDIEWHMIGHLQRNKVKYISPFVSLIHGVDSLRLLKEINKQGQKINRAIPCLLQMHIAQEQTKFGFSLEELKELIETDILSQLPFANIKGLMGMATFTNNTNQVTQEFKQLKASLPLIKPYLKNLPILSMGMSGDYSIAIAQGSNMVRIGSSIFGARNT